MVPVDFAAGRPFEMLERFECRVGPGAFEHGGEDARVDVLGLFGPGLGGAVVLDPEAVGGLVAGAAFPAALTGVVGDAGGDDIDGVAAVADPGSVRVAQRARDRVGPAATVRADP